MSWREERDALIAQTLAFVQSVTGRPADFSQLTPPSDAAIPPAAPIQSPPPASSERRAETPVEAAEAGRDASQEPAHPTPIPPSASPPTVTAEVAAPPPESITGHPFTSIASQLGLQRDMQAEIRARVATFRANQERFNRERQEYFSSTLDRLRASMNDVRRSDK
jgi:hypothetical protein